ncbi:MAG TPA: hypothetical protein VGG17_09190 [Acidimicrobiales bacterium]|jgi:hypothetical protein
MNRGTSKEHVESVVAIPDRVLRNYWVTQTYADLSKGLQTLLAPNTANWCTFATWASCSVGASMRGEALPQWLYERVLLPDGLMGAVAQTKQHHGWSVVAQHVHDLTPEHLLDVIRELFGEMSINLSDGNTEVFAEIAPPAAQMLAAYDRGEPETDSLRASVLAACDGATEFGGINHLRAGYALWCDALATSDPTRRSQLILAGSLHLGVHEQNHLQAVILASMDMGVNQAATRLKQKLATNIDLANALDVLDDALRPAVRGIGDLWDDIMTATLGTLTSPEGTMRLDHDVPARPNVAFVPPDVAPVIVAELALLREQFDRAHEAGKGSYALDWANFGDRMNFIANLFISRHHEPLIFEAPISEAELVELCADRVPAPTKTAV